MHRVLSAAILLATVGGCDVVAPPLPDPPDLPDPPGPDDVVTALEAAVLEKLECDETLRPSTLARIRDVIKGADVDTVRALLLNPQDLASVVALGGPQIEAPIVIGRNLLALVESGTAADLMTNGWDGVLCGEAVPLLCTAGGETTTVACDVSGRAQTLTMELAGCTLGGTVYDGDVIFTRDVDDDAIAAVTFGEFTLNEFRRLDGNLVVNVGAGNDAFVAAVSAPDVFEFFEHGGLARGLECSSETTFETVAIDVTGDADPTAAIAMVARHASADVSIGVETFNDGLTFAGDCGCPQPGSGMFIDVPRPLGQAGETGRARVQWVAATDASLCSQPRVELVDWPSDCSALDDVDGDCARGATEDTLEQLMTALCTR